MIKAIIFDYDGLLVDTEDMWFESQRRLCREYGVEITEENRLELMRGNLSSYLVKRFSIDERPEVLRPKLNSIFDELSMGEITPLPGAIALVKGLNGRYPLAVASSSGTGRVSKSLKSIGLHSCFKAIIGGDQVENGKPAPDIFLKAAEELGVDPSECLVFEDQPNGIAAAKSASMKCIAVPNKYLKNVDYSKADIVVSGLDSVTEQLIKTM